MKATEVSDKQERIARDVYEIGPLNASRIHRASLLDIVEAMTEGTSENGNIIEQTNATEGNYRKSGLAIYAFPTFFHRELSEEKKTFQSTITEQERLLTELKQKNDGDIEKRKETERAIKALEKKLRFLHQEEENIDLGGILVSQYKEDGKVVEIYSTGGYPVGSKAYMPHKYRVHKYDIKTGISVDKRFPQYISLPLDIMKGLLWLGTLTASAMVIDAVSWPAKKSLERKILKKAQENWEKLGKN